MVLSTPNHIIGSDAALRALESGDLQPVDCRWYLDGRSGLEAFRSGHLPGAAFADIDRHLSDLSRQGHGRHPLPSEEHFIEALFSIGIDPGSPIVAYDDAGGAIAARLWWMGTQLSMPVMVLDGGIQGWPGTLEVGESRRKAIENGSFDMGEFSFGTGVISTDELAARLRNQRIYLLDARAPERYQGAVEGIDPRSGHIPSATSLHSARLLDNTNRFLARHDIATLFTAGASSNNPEDTIASCGSGITACHLILGAQYAMGLRPLLYEGSFSAWSQRSDLPVALGDEPGSMA